MKIRDIHIDGFGIWHDRTWEGLSEGVNVFHGPNEAGKTTLMSFVRSILFGFERRSHPRRYEPQNGGEYGGSLSVTTRDGGQVRIRRGGGKHVRGSVALDSGGAGDELAGRDPERVLEDLLGGTTRTLYHNVFAFGLEELEHFRTLEESEVASHISGAGMGVGARRWSRVWKDLDDRRGSLYLPRGQNAVLNRSLRELEAVREELDATASQPEEYFEVLGRREELAGEILEIERAVAGLGASIAHHRKEREAEPHRKRRRELAEALDALEKVERFPAGGAERLNVLFDRRRELEEEIARIGGEGAGLRESRRDLARRFEPQDLIRRTRAVEELRLLLPRRDASEEKVTSATARRDELVLEKERVAARQKALEPPPGWAMTSLVVLISGASAALHFSGYGWGLWAAPVLLAALAWWHLGRRRSVRRLDTDVAEVDRRIRDAESGLGSATQDARQVAFAIGRFVGRSDYSQVDLETEALRVREMRGHADEVRALEDRLDGLERQSELARKQCREVGGKIGELLREGGAATENEFFRRAELYERRRQLLADLDRTPSPLDEALPEGVTRLDADGFREAVTLREASVARLAEARTEAGRLEERLATLSRSEQRSRARLREQSVMTEIDLAAGKWAVLTLCQTLLSDTRQIYETERQPEVLRHASAFFSRVTGGSWARVLAALDSGILVETPTGDRVSPENLSRGTAEQLYLAMRLALVRECSRHVEVLPVILDDIFVNFDPERTRRSLEAVGELASTHQVLMFTCHPHLVRLAEEIVPSARRYPLQ